MMHMAATHATATFGAGCFWGVEERFRRLPGVVRTEVGYSGGHTEHPTYEQVCAGDTGHAEVVRIEYDAGGISYEKLLDVFWSCHDPTQVNRQGPDLGTQYRSVIFYHSETDRALAESSKQAVEASGRFRRPIATAIEAAGPFWRAEDYHQQYIARGGRGACQR